MKIKYLFLLCTILLFSCSSKRNQNQKSAEPKIQQEIPDGAISLFDGQSLDGWEITNFGPQGPVRVSGGKIIINMGDGCSGITYTNDFPTVNYEVGLEARKITGNDFFCGLTFPVGDRFCSLIVGGWGGPIVGLSTIDGLDASENETRILKNFEKDVWYSIHLQVNDSSIVAKIDGEELVNFNYTNHEIGIRPEVSLSKPFGLCTWMTSAEIRNFWLRESSN